MAIQIITDAGADLSKEEQEKYGIEVIPIKVFADGKEYLSGTELFSDEFYDILESAKEIPTTSQPTTLEIQDVFFKYVKEGKEILVLALSSCASGTYNNMNLAKSMILEEYPDAVIEIIDTQAFAYIYGYASILASEMAKEGKAISEIKEEIQKFLDTREAIFIPNSLTYLEKGGRINKASLVFGNLLDIVPVLSLRNGLVEAISKVRGRKKLAKKMIKYVQENLPDQNGKTLLVLNGRMEEETIDLIDALKELYPTAEIKRAKVGPTIATHIGPVFSVICEKGM